MQSFFRKNKILLFIALIIIVLISFAFIPATEKDYIVINAPLNNTLSAIQKVPNWKKWHPRYALSRDSIRSADNVIIGVNDTIHVLKVTAFGILVKEVNQEREELYSLGVRPGEDPNLSMVEIRFGTTVLKLLYHEAQNLATSNLNPILKSLRRYLETPELYYGYPIVFRGVTDTLVITTTSEATPFTVPDSLGQMFDRLYQFTRLNKLTITDSPIAFIQRGSPPVKRLMAGLPVNHEAAVDPQLQFQRMPQGRMLTVDFTGNYEHIQKAYIAADKFITDHNLKTVALPYERYYNKAVTPADSTQMKIRIYFPIL